MTEREQKLIECFEEMLNFKLYNTVYCVNNYVKSNNGKNNNNSLKLACFDLDHTLIKPKGNRKLPKDKDDYVYMDNVKPILYNLIENGFQVVVFSNQSGSKLEQVVLKLQNIIIELIEEKYTKIPISVFIALKDDYFRKPHTGMFELFLNLNKLKIENFEEIFYCGDAAGRKGDFACSDYAFAHNLSLKYNKYNKENKENKKIIEFYTPEQIFIGNRENRQNKKEIFECKENPVEFVKEYYEELKKNPKKFEIEYPKPIDNSSQEIVVMCGLPGSGKSSIAKLIYEKSNNYVIVSKDIYKTRSMSFVKEALKKGLSVVIDDTNVDIKSREVYIKLIDEINNKKLSNKTNNSKSTTVTTNTPFITIKCIHVNTSIDMCKHLNDMRVEIGKEKVSKVPDIAYNVLLKKYTEPKIEEGFDTIYTIPFQLPNIENIKLIPTEFYYIYR